MPSTGRVPGYKLRPVWLVVATGFDAPRDLLAAARWARSVAAAHPMLVPGLSLPSVEGLRLDDPTRVELSRRDSQECLL